MIEVEEDSHAPSEVFVEHAPVFREDRGVVPEDVLEGPPPGGIPRVGVIVPTLNESENVANLLGRLNELFPLDMQIVVVDDNSTDGTPHTVHSFRERFGRVHIIQRTERRGIGSAVRDGLAHILENTDSEYVVTMDADGSHDPRQLPRLLEAARDVDFVQGSRYVAGGEIVGWPLTRRLLSVLGNNACRFLFRTGLREHTTFYRVFNRRSARVIATVVEDDGYAWGVRSLLAVIRSGLTVREVPITFADRTYGESKMGTAEVIGWIASVARLFLGQ
jgi:dolichol-phosphate mannosyltransferase